MFSFSHISHINHTKPHFNHNVSLNFHMLNHISTILNHIKLPHTKPLLASASVNSKEKLCTKPATPMAIQITLPSQTCRTQRPFGAIGISADFSGFLGMFGFQIGITYPPVNVYKKLWKMAIDIHLFR